MATLTGEGVLKKGVNVLMSVDMNRVDSKGRYYCQLQIDQSLKNPEKVASGEKPADKNPYLVSDRKHVEPSNGQPYDYTDHGVWLSKEQLEEIHNVTGGPACVDSKGNPVYGFQAKDLKRAYAANRDEHGKVLRDEKGGFQGTHLIGLTLGKGTTIEKSTNRMLGRDTMERQEAVTKAAREYDKAQREAAKSAPQAQEQATVPNPFADQPQAPQAEAQAQSGFAAFAASFQKPTEAPRQTIITDEVDGPEEPEVADMEPQM